MFGRSKTVSLVKPKKLHSLDYLKYLYSVLQKNLIVNEQNCEIVVEAIRLIAEILIWGDQNDSMVMDFFLEKNMLEHFVKYLKQDPGRSLCVQLLQTLNILFENISNQTAIYYLLSSNHTNEIITHRFDFSDEEVVAYYVSFLKTLSLRLNPQTINFFYFEQRREFDLYVEAIKLFCHPESMVRIAVRTITLNVHRVKDEGALEFLHHQTSVPYFSYLVWSIGNTIMDVDAVLRSDLSPHCCSKLGDLVAEHIDHLHYVNDLLSLDIEAINEVLCDQLLHRLLIPLHVYSLTKRQKPSKQSTRVSRPHVCNPVAALMLLHAYLIIQHPNLIRILTEAIFLGDPSLTDLVPGWNSRLNPSNTNDNRDDQMPSIRLDSTEDPDTDTDASEDDVNPAMRIAESLLAATMAMRRAQNAAPGTRLSAYMETERSLNRYPAFTQPSESLEACLRRAKGVTPALLASVWPSSLEPLKLTGQSKKLSDANVSMSNPASAIIKDSLQKTTELAGSVTDSQGSDIDTPPPDRQSPREQGRVSGDELPLHADALFPVGSTPNFRNYKLSKSLPTLDHICTETSNQSSVSFDLQGRPFLRALYRTLEVGPGTDYDTLFTLLLLQAIRTSKGIDEETLQLIHLTSPNINGQPKYDELLVGKLLDIVSDGCKAGSRVRLVTLHVAIQLLTELVCDASAGCQLCDEHFAKLISAREEAMMVLRSYFQNDAIFLDVFEHELRRIRYLPISLKKLAMDSNLLIPPLTTSVLSESAASSSVPGTGIAQSTAEGALSRLERCKRLPQSQLEHTQHAIDVYLLIHIWLESLLRVRPDEVSRAHGEAAKTATSTSTVTPEMASLFSNKLPVELTSVPGLAGLGDVPDPKITLVHKAGDKLDLSSEALIGCTVECAGSHEKRFLVNYSQQLVLVEPDSKQMGWGVITFIGPLQDLEATCDPADSRCLHVNINQPGHLSSVAYSSPNTSASGNRRLSTKPLLSARFLFEDHIRCMTARHMLLRNRELARHTKLRKIATLLDFSPHFIRDTFSSGGLGYASTTSNLTSLLEPAARAAAVRSRTATQNTSIDLSSGSATQETTSPGARQHVANRDPGSFLMERQNRARAHRNYHDVDLAEGRMPLITLAGRSVHLTSKKESANQPSAESPQGSSPTSARHRIDSNSVAFQNPPLFQQPIASTLQPPKFTILPPSDESRNRCISLSSPLDVSKSPGCGSGSP